MIKIIARYIGIGVLLGIGISLADLVYFKLVKAERIEFVDEIKKSILEVRDMLFVEGMDSIFSSPKEYDPSLGLSFSLQSFKKQGEHILVSGTITNTGIDVWSGMYLEVEAFNEGGAIIAECSRLAREINPGHWESVIIECPIVEEFIGREINEVSFSMKKAFHGKRVIKDSQWIPVE